MKRLALVMAVLATVGFAGTSRAALSIHVPVLMFHNIECANSTTRLPGNWICPAALDAEMALLQSKGWHTITADQLAQDVTNGVCPGNKTFVITVDDGSLNGYTNGAPIWESHGFRATFAMVTGRAGDFLDPNWPNNPGNNPAKPHFSWAQARDLIARGHGIANHTVQHTAVKNDSTSQLNAEVQVAQDTIRSEVGFAPKVFVYPYGSFGTAETPYLAARFTLAFTDPGSGGAVNGADETTDPMHAPRIRVSRSSTPTTVLRSLNRFAVPC